MRKYIVELEQGSYLCSYNCVSTIRKIAYQYPSARSAKSALTKYRNFTQGAYANAKIEMVETSQKPNNNVLVGFGVYSHFTNYGVLKITSNSAELYVDGELIAITRLNVWTSISDRLKKVFNDRLRSKKIGGWQWQEKTLVDRLLTKELAVLFWMADELGSKESALLEWSKHTPEELWWLYSQARSNPKWQKALAIVGGSA